MSPINIYPSKRDYVKVTARGAELKALKQKLWALTEELHPVTYDEPLKALKASKVVCVALKGGGRAYALKIPFKDSYYRTEFYS